MTKIILTVFSEARCIIKSVFSSTLAISKTEELVRQLQKR